MSAVALTAATQRSPTIPPQPLLPQVPGACAGDVGRRSAGEAAAGSLFPRGLTLPAPVGAIALQNKAAVSPSCSARRQNAARHRGRPAPPRRRDRRRRGAAQLGSGDAAPSACPLHRAGRRPLARPHALDRLPARVLPVGQGARPAVPAALSRTSRRRLRQRRAALLRPSHITSLAAPRAFAAHCAVLRINWVVYANRPSVAPSRCWPISGATPTALPSPIAASSP
jgi:hypothetical protein